MACVSSSSFASSSGCAGEEVSVGEAVMLRAAEVGEEGKRIGEVVDLVEVVERAERVGEVEGEKRLEVMRVGEIERGEPSEVEL